MKLFMIMEYNKKKKCVVAFCHFLFFFNLLLLSLFIFEDQYFQGGVLTYLFYGCCLCFLYCKLFSLLWLFTPFQMSIGKKQKTQKKAQYCPNLPDPLIPPLSLSVPSVAGKKLGDST